MLSVLHPVLVAVSAPKCLWCVWGHEQLHTQVGGAAFHPPPSHGRVEQSFFSLSSTKISQNSFSLEMLQLQFRLIASIIAKELFLLWCQGSWLSNICFWAVATGSLRKRQLWWQSYFQCQRMKNNSESVENSCCVGPGVQCDTLALLQKEFA